MRFQGRYRDYILPDKLNSLSVSIFLDELKDTPGGVGANIAYSLALLGDEPILVGSVGPEATTYIDRLARSGVNTKYIHESNLPTASFNVITDGDQNQIGGFYPGAMFDSDMLTFARWQHEDPLVVVAPHDPKAMKQQVQECKEWSLRLFYDVGQQVSNLKGEDMRAGIETAEVLIVNEYEMTILSKKVGMSIGTIKSSVPVVVTTLGKDGSIIEGASISEPIRVGVAKPMLIADPTGAGDAFRSGFLHGYVRQWPLKTCAQLGATCAAFAIEQIGTQGHSFTFKKASKRYQDAFKEALTTKEEDARL